MCNNKLHGKHFISEKDTNSLNILSEVFHLYFVGNLRVHSRMLELQGKAKLHFVLSKIKFIFVLIFFDCSTFIDGTPQKEPQFIGVFVY